MNDKDEAWKPVRVAWVMTRGVVPYKVSVLMELATRPDINLDVYHGPAKPGSGFPQEDPDFASAPIRLEAMGGYPWPFGKRRIAWLRGTWRVLLGPYDVVVCQETVNNLSVWTFAAFSRLLGKRLVLLGWGYRPDSDRRAVSATLHRLARRMLYRFADAMIAYTENGRDECVSLGMADEQVFVAYNTIDVGRLREIEQLLADAEVVEARSALAPTGGPLLLFVGRLQEVKRVDIIIDAVVQLNQGGQSVSLAIVGDGPERRHLEKRAGSADYVQFLGAIYDERELAPLFLAAELLVIPGRVGLTCIHGFAHGLPVVTTSNSATPQTPEFEYIEHDRNGVVVDVLSVEAYVETLAELLESRGRLESLRSGARRSAEKMTLGRMVEGFLAAVRFVATR